MQTEAMSYHRRWDTEMCLLEADSRERLILCAEQLSRRLAAKPEFELKDLAYTLNSRRQSGAASRLALVAASNEELDRRLLAALKRLRDPQCRRIKEASGIYFSEEPLSRQGELAFLFPGEGAQYPFMLADLCMHFCEVRSWFDLMDRAFIGHPRGYLPSQCVFPTADATPSEPAKTVGGSPDRLWHMDSAVEAVFTANQALFALLNRLEIRPQVALGHSSGEYSALLASEALQVRDDEEMISHILRLNAVYETLEADGRIPKATLLSVGTTDAALIGQVMAQSQEPLYLAMDNCPHQVILCGTDAATRRAAEHLRHAGAVCDFLPFHRAYHTPLFESCSESLRKFWQRLPLVPPRLKLYSCATAQLFPDDPDGIRDLAAAQWAQPVRFRETIEAMYEAGVRLFVESGPRGNLTAFVEDILRGRPHVAIAANVPGRSGITQLNHLVGLLAAHGVPMQLVPLYARRAPVIIPLELEPEGSHQESEQAPRTGGMSLSLRLPMLHLAADPPIPGPSPQKEIQREIQKEMNLLPMEAAMEAAPDRVNAIAGASLPLSPARVGPDLKPDLKPVSAGPETAHGRAQVMAEYLQTSEQWLTVQQQVMQTFLTVKRAAVPAAPEAVSAPPREVPRASPATGGGLPFLRDIVSCQQGREAVVRCRLDLDEDLFLWDHTLAGPISTVDETLIGLPVVPFTVSLEMLAEAASLLYPNRVVIGMEDIRAHRWIVLEEESLTLEIVARVYGKGDRAEVQIREVGTSDTSQSPPLSPLIEGKVLFADRMPPPFPAAVSPLSDERQSKWPTGAMYRGTGMFHGPQFQLVHGIDRTGREGTRATLIGRALDRFFRSDPDPKFLTDPVLLDAMGQVVGYWTGDRYETGLSVFPFHLKRLNLYHDGLRTDQKALCDVHVHHVDNDRITSDIRALLPDGSCLVEMIAWEDRRLDLPKTFYDFRIGPRDVMMSRPLPARLQELPDPQTFRACLLDPLPDSVFGSHGMIWLRVLAYMVLNRTERQVWQGLKTRPLKRRLEWLEERVAAKDAVRLLLKERYHLAVCPADIEIVTNARGQPEARGAWQSEREVIVSLTHTADGTVAIAGLAGRENGAGIDPAGGTPSERG